MHRSEKHQIYTAGLILSACVLFAVAGWITYQVGTVYETMPTPADLTIQNFFFSLRGPVQNVIVCALTHLSDTMTIVLFCLILLLLPNRKTYGLPVSLACLGGVAVYKPMKHLVLRARPDEVFHLVTQGGYSFPSGHSVTSIVFYGLLLYLIQKHCQNQKLKTALSWVCGILAIAIGPSRVYVGVHWPTDVLAGWCIGGGVLLIAILILQKLERRSAMRG